MTRANEHGDDTAPDGDTDAACLWRIRPEPLKRLRLPDAGTGAQGCSQPAGNTPVYPER